MKITTNQPIMSAIALTLTLVLSAQMASADIFDDLVELAVTDVSSDEALVSLMGVEPTPFDLELEFFSTTGVTIDINPGPGCDFLVTIGHFGESGPVGHHLWEITDIHMRTPDGTEQFHKITGIEPLPGGLSELPTLEIEFTDWICAIHTGEFEPSSEGLYSDYIVHVALIGDTNNDCEINLLDVDSFVELLLAQYYDVAADINQDGALDLLDVSEFIGLLSE